MADKTVEGTLTTANGFDILGSISWIDYSHKNFIWVYIFGEGDAGRVLLAAENDQKEYLEQFKEGDIVHFKGKIEGGSGDVPWTPMPTLIIKEIIRI